MKMEEKDRKTILELYFDKVYNYDEIIETMGNKYTYKEIKAVVMEKYKPFWEHEKMNGANANEHYNRR